MVRGHGPQTTVDKEAFAKEIEDATMWTGAQATAASVLDTEHEVLEAIKGRLAPSLIADVPGDWPGHAALESIRLCAEVAVAAACGFPSGLPNASGAPWADRGAPLEELGTGPRRMAGVTVNAHRHVCRQTAGRMYEAVQQLALEARATPWPWSSIERGEVRGGARAEEIFAALDALSRAGDSFSNRALDELRELLRGRPVAPGPQRARRWHEWEKSLAHVKHNVGCAMGDADLGGVALLVVARRLSLPPSVVPRRHLIALARCRAAATSRASIESLLNEALRQLDGDDAPRQYKDAVDAARRKDRSRHGRATNAPKLKEPPRERRSRKAKTP